MVTENSRSKNFLRQDRVNIESVWLSDGGQKLEGSLPRLKATSEQPPREAKLTNPSKILVVKNTSSQVVPSLSEVLSSD
jgi:hypothetical protein